MKAVVLKGVKDLVVEEVPTPQIDERNNILVKVDMCGLCGTDVHMWGGTNFEGRFPFIPGHEWVGRVIKVGSNAKNLKVGDRVTGEVFLPCGVCINCKDGINPNFCLDPYYYGFFPECPGALAEYLCTPEQRLFKIPDSLNDEIAALTEPVAVAYAAVWRRGGGVGPHDRVGVIGCGPIGLFAASISSVTHPLVIVVEPMPYRLKMAKDFGIKLTIDPSKENVVDRVKALTGGRGLTHIIECSGNPAGIASTIDLISPDGKIMLTGHSLGTKVSMEIGKIIWTHGTITGSCGNTGYTQKVLDFLAKNLVPFDKSITHRFYLDDALEAFALGIKGTESGKIMIYMDSKKIPK